jgi:O-succinylbenzoic acid--CoA ligase
MEIDGWLDGACARAPGRTAIETPAGSWTYAELALYAHAGAGELAGAGVGPGAHVAIALPAGLAFAQALHACLLLGAVAVPIDLRLGAAERELLMAGCAVRIEQPLVTAGAAAGGDRHAGRPDDAAGDHGAGGDHDAGGDHRVGRAPVRHDLDATALVVHTSGTTAAPRPVRLSYGNLLWSALGSGVALGADPQERWLCALPLSHVGGLSILMRSAIYATTAIVHERFETERVLAALREQRVTLVSLVATTLARLLDAGLERPPALRCALTGGGPVPSELVARAARAGVPVGLTYGLTETCSQVTTTPAAELEGGSGGDAGTGRESGGGLGGDARTGSESGGGLGGDARTGSGGPAGAGPPLFCTRVRIASDGEIMVAGPTVAPSAKLREGWLATGDLGRLDERGRLQVVGRKADTIVSGGENVAPAEVEAVLEAHPQVLEAAVVGRPDEQWGEALAAWVVARPGVELDSAELREHCRRSLAPYKVPKDFAQRDRPLPRTASGKLLRRELA